jgi:hypothetical protein
MLASLDVLVPFSLLFCVWSCVFLANQPLPDVTDFVFLANQPTIAWCEANALQVRQCGDASCTNCMTNFVKSQTLPLNTCINGQGTSANNFCRCFRCRPDSISRSDLDAYSRTVVREKCSNKKNLFFPLCSKKNPLQKCTLVIYRIDG